MNITSDMDWDDAIKFYETDDFTGGYAVLEDAYGKPVEMPYYPAIAEKHEDYVLLARIMAAAFGRDGMDMLHQLHMTNELVFVMRKPDHECGMGCCPRKYKGSPCGGATMDLSETQARINSFCIDRDEQRKGLGSALLEAMVTYARHAGVPDRGIWLASNPESVGFYERNGFVRSPRGKGERSYSISMDSIIMHREETEV